MIFICVLMHENLTDYATLILCCLQWVKHTSITKIPYFVCKDTGGQKLDIILFCLLMRSLFSCSGLTAT